MTDSNWTLRFPRTSRCTGHAIEVYRTPLYKRMLLAFCRRGWLIVPAVLAGLVLTGCSSDIDDAIAVQADLADAVAMAAKDAGK